MAVMNTARNSAKTGRAGNTPTQPPRRKKEEKEEKERYLGSVRFFKNIITLFFFLLVSGLIALVVYLWYQQGKEPSYPQNVLTVLPGPVAGDGRGILVTPDNVNQIRERPPTGDTYLNTHMTNQWDFPAWNAPSDNALVANPVTNTRIIYIEVRLELPNGDFGEMIYDSPYIPLGARLTDFPLHKSLPKGVHPAIVTYYLVDDDFKIITTMDVAVTITIHS